MLQRSSILKKVIYLLTLNQPLLPILISMVERKVGVIVTGGKEKIITILISQTEG